MANTAGIVLAMVLIVVLGGAYTILQPTIADMQAHDVSYVYMYYVANLLIGGIAVIILVNSVKTGRRK